jgi:hypothetical protein
MMRTMVTFEIIGDVPTWEQFEAALQPLGSVSGVASATIRSSSNRSSMSSSHWVTLDMELVGPAKPTLRQMYEAVSRRAMLAPLRLSGPVARSTISTTKRHEVLSRPTTCSSRRRCAAPRSLAFWKLVLCLHSYRLIGAARLNTGRWAASSSSHYDPYSFWHCRGCSVQPMAQYHTIRTRHSCSKSGRCTDVCPHLPEGQALYKDSVYVILALFRHHDCCRWRTCRAPQHPAPCIRLCILAPPRTGARRAWLWRLLFGVRAWMPPGHARMRRVCLDGLGVYAGIGTSRQDRTPYAATPAGIPYGTISTSGGNMRVLACGCGTLGGYQDGCGLHPAGVAKCLPIPVAASSSALFGYPPHRIWQTPTAIPGYRAVTMSAIGKPCGSESAAQQARAADAAARRQDRGYFETWFRPDRFPDLWRRRG